MDEVTPEYVPTLGEYAAVIEWLSEGYVGQIADMPPEIRKPYDDAIRRASLRRFVKMLNDAIGPD